MSVRKAVIPAAGLGTRFLPATKAQPKEMITVVDRPAIQYVVEEAVRGGCTDILIVSSSGKDSIGDHFDRLLDVEQYLESKGKLEELDEIKRLAELADIHYVRQNQPLGLGHAVATARHHVGNEPFVVLLPDMIVPEPRPDETDLLARLIELHSEHDCSVISVYEVPKEDVGAYGVIDGEPLTDGVLRLTDMVEKPSPEDAPTNLVAPGRYLFTAEIFDVLEGIEPGAGDEIQLTDAIKVLAEKSLVLAYVHRDPIYDVGKKLDYLRATVELALRRDDLGKVFGDYLRGALPQE